MIPHASGIDPTTHLQLQANLQQQRPDGGGKSLSTPSSSSVLRHDTLTQKAIPFSTEVAEQFPHLKGRNHHHVFIAGSDGVIRRFPSDFSPDRPAATSLPDRWKHRLEMQGMTASMLDPAESWRVEKLDKHGSCMLGFDHVKWVMLDSLEQLSPDH